MKRVEPKAGQESVWDYPRPPRVEPCPHRVWVVFNGEIVVDSTRAWRLLETSHPPSYYIPREDVRMEFLRARERRSFCEFKGAAEYWDLVVGEKVSLEAAWSYPSPGGKYAVLRDCLAFYAGRVDACYVGQEKVTPLAGGFYGGCITSDVVGPFKGGPGTMGW